MNQREDRRGDRETLSLGAPRQEIVFAAAIGQNTRARATRGSGELLQRRELASVDALLQRWLVVEAHERTATKAMVGQERKPHSADLVCGENKE